MSRGQRSLHTLYDDWAGEKVIFNNENRSSAINKGEIRIANNFSTNKDRILDLEAQLEELKTKRKNTAN